jgi:hypothetical protein
MTGVAGTQGLCGCCRLVPPSRWMSTLRCQGQPEWSAVPAPTGPVHQAESATNARFPIWTPPLTQVARGLLLLDSGVQHEITATQPDSGVCADTPRSVKSDVTWRNPGDLHQCHLFCIQMQTRKPCPWPLRAKSQRHMHGLPDTACICWLLYAGVARVHPRSPALSLG